MTTQEQLRSIWKSLLKTSVVRDDDDFFELGGDSLRGIELAFLVEQRFGVTLDHVEILKEPTFGGFSSLVSAEIDARAPAAKTPHDPKHITGKL